MPGALTTDYRWKILTGRSFVGERDLVGANFAFADLTRVDFRGCDLRDASFDTALLVSTRFEHANLEGANFANAWTGRTQAREKLVALCAFCVGFFLCFVATVLVTGVLADGSRITTPVAFVHRFAVLGLIAVSSLFCTRGPRGKWVILLTLLLVIACKLILPWSGSWPEIGFIVFGLTAPILAASAITVLGTPAVIGGVIAAGLLTVSVWWDVLHNSSSTFAPVLAFVAAAGLLLLVIAICAHRSNSYAPGFKVLHSAKQAVGRVGGTRFNGARLRRADFLGARLTTANFRSADCKDVRWPDSTTHEHLKRASI